MGVIAAAGGAIHIRAVSKRPACSALAAAQVLEM